MDRQQPDVIKHAYRNLTDVVDLDKGVQKSEKWSAVCRHCNFTITERCRRGTTSGFVRSVLFWVRESTQRHNCKVLP